MAKKFENEWVFEDFSDHPSFKTKRMFGGLAVYLFERQMLLIVEPTKSGRWNWHGILVCTSLESQASLLNEFSSLQPHPILKKWLFIETSHENFEPTIEKVIRRISENDIRIGIFPKTKSNIKVNKIKGTLQIQKELRRRASPKVAKQSQYYFKTQRGEYGYGDMFIGVKSSDLRNLAKVGVVLKFVEIQKLIKSKIHEERALGLLILVYKFRKSKTESEKTEIFDFYVNHFKYINSWDLVDCSCPYIVGPYLLERDRKILYKWAKSDHLWTKRIAMVSNWWLIRQGDLSEVFKVATILLKDEHDLIHKAVGWMLREAGKKEILKLEAFLKRSYRKMPRTMLRYAIEKFPEKKRQKYLMGKV